MKAQAYTIKKGEITPENTMHLPTVGATESSGSVIRAGRDWCRYQACQDEHLILNMAEMYGTKEFVRFTRQERFIKFNFWLSGRHTTELSGYGSYEHDGPEVFLTAGPLDVMKVDLFPRDSRLESVALCVLPEFFPVHLGLSLDDLPKPLRDTVQNYDHQVYFRRYPMDPEIMAAARAILTAPFEVRRLPVYCRAKSVELMCLLIAAIRKRSEGGHSEVKCYGRHESRLKSARDIIQRRFDQPITLGQIGAEVGLNRAALTTGFRLLFGLSIHDLIQQLRMERAYALLSDEHLTVAQVAIAVGFEHPCNFSTAFKAYFGAHPSQARRS